MKNKMRERKRKQHLIPLYTPQTLPSLPTFAFLIPSLGIAPGQAECVRVCVRVWPEQQRGLAGECGHVLGARWRAMPPTPPQAHRPQHWPGRGQCHPHSPCQCRAKQCHVTWNGAGKLAKNMNTKYEQKKWIKNMRQKIWNKNMSQKMYYLV